MNNVCTNNMSDAMVLEQFSEIGNEIRKIEEIATDPFAARTECPIGGGGNN